VTREGSVRFRNFNTWYRIVGERRDARRWPLLTLHGGPGAAHDCLEPLSALADDGREVIFYDQLGCGRSDRPHNPSMWTFDLFLEELACVREALGLTDVHLLGLSWGGMLGLEYALRHPRGLRSLIVASAPASNAEWMAEAERLRRELPANVQETLLKHELAGTTESDEYTDAMLVFYRRHVCRSTPWPDPVARSMQNMMSNPEVYAVMNGPSEFHITGTFRDWSVADRLGEIDLPVLVTSGRYDECTPRIAATVTNGIPGAVGVIFEESAHFAHAEEPERYASVVRDFLERVEGGVMENVD